jgi:filamin
LLTGSPFRAVVSDTTPAESPAANVKCYGAGLQPKTVRRGQPAVFTIDASKAPVAAPANVVVTDLTTGVVQLRQVFHYNINS